MLSIYHQSGHRYVGVRKVKWDQLWHALYQTDSFRFTWDRVSRQQARYIIRQLFAGKKGKDQ